MKARRPDMMPSVVVAFVASTLSPVAEAWSHELREAPPLHAPVTASAASAQDEYDAVARQLLRALDLDRDGALIDGLVDALSKRLPTVPPEVWEKVRAGAASEESTRSRVAIYRRHFSLEELKGLLAFWQSPLGRRYVQEEPGLLTDYLATVNPRPAAEQPAARPTCPPPATAADAVLDYDSPPRPIHIERPQYPRDAFDNKIQGTVLLELLIDSEGRVARVRVIKSVSGLDDAAMRCARAWLFSPAVKHGRPVPTIAQAPVTFRLE